MERESENIRNFFDSVQDFMFVLDEQGGIRHVNRAVTDRLGYTREELLGMPVVDVHPPARRAEAAAIVADMLAGRRELCPVPLMAKDGTLIPVETRVVKGVWNGKPALFGVSKDVSDLQRSEEKFALAFNNNAAIMAISTMDEGLYIDVNNKFLRTFGYRREEVVGKCSSELDIFIDPRQRDDILRQFQESNYCLRDVELRVRTSSGKILDGLFSIDRIVLDGVDCLLTVMIDITGLKILQRRYDQLFKEMHDAFAVHEMIYDEGGIAVDYRFLAVNPAFEEMTGAKGADIIGKTLSEIFPQAEPEWVARYAEVVEKGEVLQFEEYARAIGKYFEVKAYRNAPGQFAVMFSDITERRRGEEKIEYLGNLQKCLMELATDFVNVDLEQQSAAIDKALERIGRLISADRAYLFIYDFVNQDTSNTNEWCAEGIEPQIDNLQHVPITAIPEWTQPHSRGELVRVDSVQSLPVGDPVRAILEPQDVQSLITLPLMSSGECVGFVGFDAVKTERFWNEEEIALLRVLAEMFANFEVKNRAEKRLLAAIAERSILLDTMDAQAWYLKDIDTYGVVNDAHAAFLGLPRERIENAGMQEFLRPEEVEVCRISNRSVFEEKRAVKTEEWVENGAGEQRLLAITKTPKLAADGRVEFVVCVAYDVTDDRLREEQLRKARADAEQAARAKSIFVANMSHEIRTPLNAILGYAQLLSQDMQDQELVCRGIAQIMKSGDHLLELIDNILTIVKSDSRRPPLRESAFRLDELLEDVRQMLSMRSSAGAARIRFEGSAAARLRIHADKGKLSQIVINLLGNAIKFSETGPIVVTLESSRPAGRCADDQCMISMRVADRGCGIEADRIDRIFDPFEQAAAGQARMEGSGLGLPLSRNYARAMGGELSVESSPGEGSVFTLTFCARLLEDSSDRSSASAPRAAPQSANGLRSIPVPNADGCAAGAGQDEKESREPAPSKLDMDWQALPKESVNSMLSAIESGDVSKLRSHLELLKDRYPAQTSKLTEIISNYDYEELIRILTRE